MRRSVRGSPVLSSAGDGGQGHAGRATGQHRARIRTAAILATGLLWTACGDSSTEPAREVLRPLRAVSVRISPATSTLAHGDTVRLVAAALDENGSAVGGAEFSWSSSDTVVARVDATGLVTAGATATGAATITAVSGAAQGTAEIRVPPRDRAILEAFYHAMDGPNWTNDENWLTDAPIREWYGVDIVGNGRVDELWLDNNGLKGRIPPELGGLGALSYLELSDNELTGPIPPEIGLLSELWELELDGNGLSGPIPAELGNLGRLRRLSLHSNELSGPIPPELGDLANVREFYLSSNRLTGPIPPELGNLRAVQYLALSQNSLTGPIPPELGNLRAVRDLSLSLNGLTGPIPPELGSLDNLWSLELDYNELTGPIPPELGSLGALSILSILRLDRNELTGPIPPELGNLASLTSVDLQSNRLTGPIPPELGNLPILSGLRLNDNGLTGPIPPELGSLVRLRSLELGSNELTGPIPPELGNLTNLSRLDLRHNGLTGPIPPEFGNLRALESLRLTGNELEGPIPVEFRGLTGLEWLTLEDNNLTGPVPSDFGALTALRVLFLANNTEMSGPIPAELSALTSLQRFMAGGTGLCVPSDPGLIVWLAGMYLRRIARCPDWQRPMAYLTQAVQSREFPVPLVAGKQALLRVFPTARESTAETIPAVRARFYLDGQEMHVTDIPAKSTPIPVRVEEGDLSTSANALIEGHVVQPGLELVIEIDPNETLDPELGVRTRIPETGRLRVDVVTMPTLDLTLIPFVLSGEPDSSTEATVGEIAADPENHELLEYVRLLLPVADLEVTAHEPVLTSARSVSAVALETLIIRSIESGTGHYLGVIPRPLGGNWSAYYWGWAGASTAVPRHLTQALALNMNMGRAPCGATRYADPLFPYPDGSIGAWGYDFRGGGRLVPPSTPEFRSACDPPFWVSDYNFSNALRFRAYRARDRDGAAPQARMLLVGGGVGEDGNPFLSPAFVVDAAASLPEAAGDHRITGLGARGEELFSLSFDMPLVADNGVSAFAFTVPVEPSWAGALDRITLSGPAGSAELNADGGHAGAILLDPRTRRVRGILREVADPARLEAEAAVLRDAGLEVLLSRGIPRLEGR